MEATWTSIRNSRKAYLDKYDEDLRQVGFRQRIRERHLIWLGMFLSISVRGISDDIRRAYCKTADRIFGGNRFEHFCEDMQKRIAKIKKESEERRKRCEEKIAAINRKYEEEQRMRNAEMATVIERRLQTEQIIAEMDNPDANKTIH